jgi:hypothetical protein
MFITKKHVSRRAVLRGMGIAMGLPFLEAMSPALVTSAKAAANPKQRRFGVAMVPLGERPNYWNPKTVGANFEFSPIMKPLEPFRDHLTVISNLCNPLDGHAVSVGAWLTGSTPKRTIAEDVLAGTSIDQVIANEIGQETVYPSLELATEDFTGYIGGCDPAYSCAYMNTLSWRNPTTPLPMEINPRIVFERLFGRPGTSAQRVERMAKERSILDSVKQDVADLSTSLGPRDRNRLDAYLENVREIERRIQRAEKQATTEIAVPDAPIGIPESFEEHAMLQFDLIALAYEADVTRVFTYMISRDASQRVYPNLGLTEPHHSMSHHGGDEIKIANLVKINTYHVSLFGRFLEKLRSTPDGDGSLLDHSLILWGSGMSESNTHSRLDIPTLLVGGGAGLMKGNRHLQMAPQTPFANLLLTLSGKYGVQAEKYGTLSTGRLEI